MPLCRELPGCASLTMLSRGAQLVFSSNKISVTGINVRDVPLKAPRGLDRHWRVTNSAPPPFAGWPPAPCGDLRLRCASALSASGGAENNRIVALPALRGSRWKSASRTRYSGRSRSSRIAELHTPCIHLCGSRLDAEECLRLAGRPSPDTSVLLANWHRETAEGFVLFMASQLLNLCGSGDQRPHGVGGGVDGESVQ